MSTTPPVLDSLRAAEKALEIAVGAAIEDRDYRLATLLGPALSVVRRRREEREEAETQKATEGVPR